MEEINLKELLDYFKSKLLLVLLAVLLIVIIGNVYTSLTRVPMYKTYSSLVLVSEDNGAKSAAYSNSEQQLNKNLIGTYSEIIKSKKVLKKVISNLDLKMSYNELRNSITVQAVDNTEVINVYVSNSKSLEATRIANEIAVVFVDEANEIYKLNNVTILDKAERVKKPYNVNYIKDNIIYIMAGLVLSCGIVFIAFYFDTTVKTSDEVEEKLGLTIIGTVPKVGKE